MSAQACPGPLKDEDAYLSVSEQQIALEGRTGAELLAAALAEAGVDIVSIVRPITKHAYQARKADDVPRLVFAALDLAAGPQ